MKSEKKQPRTIMELESLLQKLWSKIKLETLENLIRSMPDRVREVSRSQDQYVIK